MDINYIRLCQIKKEIKELVEEAEKIIKINFPTQHLVSYSFWIPQIITALEEDDRWLSRSDYSMQNTIDKIKINTEND